MGKKNLEYFTVVIFLWIHQTADEQVTEISNMGGGLNTEDEIMMWGMPFNGITRRNYCTKGRIYGHSSGYIYSRNVVRSDVVII